MKLLCLWLLMLSALPAMAVQAQTPPTPPSQSLTEALRLMPATSVADGSVVLTVVSPIPLKAILPDIPVATPDSIAAQFGRTGQWFGHVYAIAPPTMTVLNTDPTLADLPLGLLAGQHPETYLLQSLTEDQLRQLGTTGLAYADMTPDQQSLLQALLPEPLEIVPATTALGAQTREVSGDDLFASLRLHGFLTADFYAHAPSGFGIGDTRGSLETTGAFKLPFGGYRNMDLRGKATETILRAEMPNSLKVGDFSWSQRTLERPVMLSGVKTVDDLVSRLAKATGWELYADTHYGPQPILLVGSMQKPLAVGEVMQALALCVCGAWRQVGPAYVLTDDVQGLGFRQQFLAEMGQTWSNRLSQAGLDAGRHLQALDWLHTLSFAPGDIGALSSEQIDSIRKEAGSSKGNLPWKALPQALQDNLRNQFLHYGDNTPSSMTEFVKMGEDMKAAAQSITPDTPVETTIGIRLAISLPSTGAMMLYDKYKVQTAPLGADDAPVKSKTPAQSNSIVLDKPLRSVLCAPKTADEARTVVARLPRMGLNTLFLDVFTNGRTYFPNKALSPVSEQASGVLQAALDAAKPLHLAVYAVLDTLCWRKDSLAPHPLPWPKGYEEDLTISEETPDRAIQRRVAANSLATEYDHPQYALAGEGTQSWASPLDPAVRDLLPPLVRTLAATKGLAGIVFQDTSPPGYDENALDEDRIGLGYTPKNRLIYLRRTHQDPIDLYSGSDRVNVFVGGENFFESYEITIPTFAAAPNSYSTWTKYRAEANLSLLTDCWRSARTTAPFLPVLLQNSIFGLSSFTPWADPKQVKQKNIEEDTDPNPYHKLNGRSILSIAYGANEQAHPETFIQQTQFGSIKGWGGKAGGLVFDLVTSGSLASLNDELDRLSLLLQKPPK
jgi:hypothetical protein